MLPNFKTELIVAVILFPIDHKATYALYDSYFMWLSEPFVAAIKEGGTKCYTHYKQTCCGYYSRLFYQFLYEYFIWFYQNDEISLDMSVHMTTDFRYIVVVLNIIKIE